MFFRLTRVCNRDVTIKGIHIKKGQMVSVPVLAMHYDEKRWKNPQDFDPERYNFAIIFLSYV